MADDFQDAEASFAASIATAPPAASIASSEPPPPAAPPGSTIELPLESLGQPTVNLTPGLESPPPAPAAPPTPTEPQAPAAEEEPAAPAIQPKASLPEGTPRNYRVAAKDPVEALALQLRVRNPDMSLGDAWTRAQTELGVAPAPAAAPAAAPEPPAPAENPLATLDARLAAIDTESSGLDPIIDAAEIRRLDLEARQLLVQRQDLVAEVRVQEALAARQQEAQTANEVDTAIAEAMAAAKEAFPQLADPQSEFSAAYAAAHEQMVAADDPLLGTPDYEVRLAKMVAGDLFAQGKLAPAATSPGAQPTPGSPSPTAPAHAPARTAPAPAGVAPVPGSAMSAEHRIQVQAADPAAQIAQEIAQASASGDFEAAEQAFAKGATGGRSAPVPSGFSISIGGQRVA